MAKSDLRIHQKKDNFLFKLIRPLELTVSIILIVALLSLLVVAAVDILNSVTLAQDFKDLNSSMNVTEFRKLYNSALDIEANIKQIIEILLSSLFAIVLTYLIVRIAANGLLFLREWHDYKKWTHSKGLFIFNIIKRAVLITLIVIVLSLASSVNTLIHDQLYSPIHNVLNLVEDSVNIITTEVNKLGGIDKITEADMSGLQTTLQQVIDNINKGIEPEITKLQDTISGPFIEDVLGKAIALGIFEVVWMVCAIVLCSISKSKTNQLSISENNVSDSKKEDDKKSKKEEKSEDKKDEKSEDE